MSPAASHGTAGELRGIEEPYRWPFLASLGIHAAAFGFYLLAPFLTPDFGALQMGTGPGGGGGESYTVGVADDLGGGAGLFKPATSPQPPVLPVEPPPKKAAPKKEEPAPSKAVPLPEPKSAKAMPRPATPAAKAGKAVPPSKSDLIPVADAKGAGGAGGAEAGTGGGVGGGVGISLGSGSGGMGDSWYARSVEARISSAWDKPVGTRDRIEIVFSFFVADDGTIYGIKKEKSSGSEALDRIAERAITLSNPLSAPPPSLRGRLLQFTCQFIYPPK